MSDYFLFQLINPNTTIALSTRGTRSFLALKICNHRVCVNVRITKQETRNLSREVPASDTKKGSGPEFWTTAPPSTKIFSNLQSLMTAEYRQDRSPKPLSVSQMQLIPMPRVKSAAPSGRSFTFLKLPGFRGFDASESSFSRP